MQITVNGQLKNIANKASLRDLVAEYTKTPERLIAEVNGTVCPKQDWIRTGLRTGDKIELITFVGGG